MQAFLSSWWYRDEQQSSGMACDGRWGHDDAVKSIFGFVEINVSGFRDESAFFEARRMFLLTFRGLLRLLLGELSYGF